MIALILLGMDNLFLITDDTELLKNIEHNLPVAVVLIKKDQLKSLRLIEKDAKLINLDEGDLDLFKMFPLNKLQEIDFIQIDNTQFEKEAIVEIANWFLETGSKRISFFQDGDDKEEVVRFKEDVLRKHFSSFLTEQELEKEIKLTKDDPAYLFDGQMYLAKEGDQLKGTGVIKYLDNNQAFLHTGYAKGFAAVSALLAIRIAQARKRGVDLFSVEVFRDNQLGTKHLKRFHFQKTDKTRSAACSDTKVVDSWIRSF
jgi:hypothetical protein